LLAAPLREPDGTVQLAATVLPSTGNLLREILMKPVLEVLWETFAVAAAIQPNELDL
jgi:hypothetical protein